MAFISKHILSALTIIVSFVVFFENVVAKDECADLFFTPAWQACFRNKFRKNWHARDLSFQEIKLPFQPFFPSIQPIIMPNVNDIIQQAQAKAQAQGFPGDSSSAFSSSAMSSASGMSKSVVSTNGRTWTIETNGLPVSTTSDGNDRHVKAIIGEPTSVVTSYGDDNSLKVNLTYGDGSVKWVKVTLVSPTNAKDLKIDQKNGILYIQGGM